MEGAVAWMSAALSDVKVAVITTMIVVVVMAIITQEAKNIGERNAAALLETLHFKTWPWKMRGRFVAAASTVAAEKRRNGYASIPVKAHIAASREPVCSGVHNPDAHWKYFTLQERRFRPS